MASVYSIHLTILELTVIRALYKSHAIPNSAHLYLSAEVTSLNWPIETVIIGSDDINGRAKNSYYAYYMLTLLESRNELKSVILIT